MLVCGRVGQVLVRFWVNHHLLDLIERPQWRVVKNRSRSYVNKVISELKDARCDTAVLEVCRLGLGLACGTGRCPGVSACLSCCDGGQE